MNLLDDGDCKMVPQILSLADQNEDSEPIEMKMTEALEKEYEINLENLLVKHTLVIYR